MSPAQDKPRFIRQPGDPDVIPPANHSQLAGHHWLLIKDYDGHEFGLICLQWQPGARRWCHSHEYDTGRDVEVKYYEYVAPCQQPLRQHEQKELLQMVRELDAEQSRADAVNGAMQVDSALWNRLRRIVYPLIP